MRNGSLGGRRCPGAGAVVLGGLILVLVAGPAPPAGRPSEAAATARAGGRALALAPSPVRPGPGPRGAGSLGRPGRAAPTPLPTPEQIARARVFSRSRAGLVAFAVVDSAGRLHCHECRRRYGAASVVKAMLLVAYLERLAAERRPLTAADDALLSPMIRLSDNAAATSVYRRVGDAGLYRLAGRAGMADFSVSGHWGNALTSARDQAVLFERLDELIPRRFGVYARRLLSSVVSWQSWGIPEVSRPRWQTFFKGGWRGTSRGQLVHQVARLERNGRSIALAILTDGNPGHGYGRETVRGIAARLLGAVSSPSAREAGRSSSKARDRTS